jgi:hypothetical protein
MFSSPHPGWIATMSKPLAYTSYGDRDQVTGEDHFAHAPGKTCTTCGRPIERWQYARRRAEAKWVHDVCPPLLAVKPQAPATTGREGKKPAGWMRRGRLRASDADRERVIDALKTAFVQDRLTKDELCLRVGLALASRTYADLAMVTADI